MNKITGLLLALALLLGIGQFAFSLDTPSLPPGISATNWIALGNRAGSVVTDSNSLIGSAGPIGVAKGYFVVQRGGNWLRLDLASYNGGAATAPP